jgi:hypothetical protein
MALIPLLVLLLLCPAARAQRMDISLNGIWEVADGRNPDSIPTSFEHKVAVPGLTHSATPAFPDVDRFDSAENIANEIRRGNLPESARTDRVGVPRQERNYFWYRTRFRAGVTRAKAFLRVGKAQFGAAVWLNGKKVGEHWPCFTAGYFDITGAVSAQNELLIRIGAHPAAVPDTVPTGTDSEKRFWTPGIYDNVSVILTGNPVLEWVQVAPQLATSSILVETKLNNYGPAGSFTVTHKVGQWIARQAVTLKQGESRTIRQTLKMPGAKLWTPEAPHLHTLETLTPGDSLKTRFGMREFRFDTATKRAYLNGKPYFLRGSNVTLHRFFEDESGGMLPWDEKWVRRLLVDVPKEMHWNAFRFCIGPVPDMWLDIADEAGLLIQNEFFIWRYRKQWDTAEMIRQFKDWMRDNWNHPSVAIWDADNETREDTLAEIIRTVRPLDLSSRPWDNGYNNPVGPDDPVEDHPYLFSRVGKGFEIPELERMTGAKSTNSPHPTGHAVILNEYGWLWMNRDGTPTVLTKDVYARLVGENATAEQRFEAYAYYLGGLTEFWRAHRNFAGVLHFVHLTSSYSGAYTSDHWADVAALKLEPHFADYVKEAFRPLGVYINFWRPALKPGVEERFQVMMVNDEYQPAKGTLTLSLGPATRSVPFEISPLGQYTYAIDLKTPDQEGAYLLKVVAQVEGKTPTLSRRKVRIGK